MRETLYIIVILTIFFTILLHRRFKHEYYCCDLIHLFGIVLGMVYFYYCYLNFSDTYFTYFNISLAITITLFHLLDLLEDKSVKINIK